MDGSAEIRFLAADNFLQTQGFSACTGLPAQSMVMNGVFWEGETKSAKKEFEVFAPAEEGKVTYGRISVEKLNGEAQCKFQRIGRVMGLSRLALPTIHFSQGVDGNYRTLASSTEPRKETDISLEFMRFDPLTAATAAFNGGRVPSSLDAQEHPPLMFRIYKVVSQLDAKDDDLKKSQWLRTEEHLYRLWRVKN